MKFKYVAIMLSCILLVGCGSGKNEVSSNINENIKETECSSTSSDESDFKPKYTDESITGNSRIDIGIEIKPIRGKKSDFDKLDINTQNRLKKYLGEFYVATLSALEHKDYVYNYKTDYIKNFETNFDSSQYSNESELNVMLDFLQLSYICGLYEVEILESEMVISSDGVTTTAIIDDAYVQYMNDLTEIISNLTNEYLN